MLIKAQIAMEYLLILGITLIMLLPIFVIVYTYTTISDDQISQRQALQIARKIVDTAETVYYFGEPTKTTLELEFPSNIKTAVVLPHTVLFVMETPVGDTDIFSDSQINLTGELPQGSGTYKLRIQALSNRVNISIVE